MLNPEVISLCTLKCVISRLQSELSGQQSSRALGANLGRALAEPGLDICLMDNSTRSLNWLTHEITPESTKSTTSNRCHELEKL